MAALNPALASLAARPGLNRVATGTASRLPSPSAPATSTPLTGSAGGEMVLELADGTSYRGMGFGAEGKSISGECVFQTGMVGYVESLTDPSYEGQILVLTYPLIGNYGVPSREEATKSLNALLSSPFESSRIHVAGLVVASYSEEYSHWLATSSLGDWLKENGVPAIYGVDTRALVKRIRDQGSMLGKLLAKRPDAPVRAPADPVVDWRSQFLDVAFADPNAVNLVAKVSSTKPQLYTPANTAPGGFDRKALAPLLHPSGRPIRILTLDVGMKYNQIRCFTSRGVELKVVPWDHDFLNPAVEQEPFDGLFISNGPGDPTSCEVTIANLRKALALRGAAAMPIFGICLGHQLLSLAAGASTKKMKFGNRGHNIPCVDVISGRCSQTSQNHGYEVDASSLPAGWKELFYNANDGSNEGVFSEIGPWFSVQFHPESTPGPRDTEYLFDVFIRSVIDCAAVKASVAVSSPTPLPPVKWVGGLAADNAAKYPRVNVRKVLVLGSGGLSIGQAGEFDYSGSQAIKALKEEGIYTILINPNIATIQTSSGLADKVYFLPVTPDFVMDVVRHERPDGIYVTFGGQTALNVGIKIKEDLVKEGVKILGTPIDTIITTEDRELFANAMAEIGEKCAPSASAVNWDEALAAARNIGFPVIVRAAFALGGLGSGFAYNEDDLRKLCNQAFANSPQVLVEKSMRGWKEVEYEVVRDGRDNCITVCNMENFDPLGVHTGDSIVVAPSQTLDDHDFNMLRSTAVSVIRHLGVVGECNIQYALNPHTREYCIIEVNARLSRSSALASKATGYPLAFIAAKLGLGIPLNEIRNSVTLKTSACFEPSLDYCVVKIPRWDLRKFVRVSSKLGSSMKSVGEVMSIGRTFEETIQKAIRAIDPQFDGFGANSYGPSDDAEIDVELEAPTDKRLFAIGNALAKGMSVERIHKLSFIDRWFLRKLNNIVQAEQLFSQSSAATLSVAHLRQAKQLGISDSRLAKCIGSTEIAVRRLRVENGIMPFTKQIDTVAAEFPAFTNYLYTTYNATEHDVNFQDQGVMVLGSGVYRIGSSVEFDWCAVRAIRTLRQAGFKTVMVNYNPETVSTDYDEADRLYFENISLETVLDIYDIERSSGVIISMGGQTPNNIALPLYRQGVKVYGTSPEMIDMAENRYKFSRMLDKIGVDQPMWKELTSFEEAKEACARFGYPVLVRPSYVLSGAAMNVVYSPEDLQSYLSQATAVNRDHPVVITKYLEGAKEIEMDAVAKDGKLMMHYVSEHVENAGVHSGDATLILPPQDLDPETVRRIEVATSKIAASLHVTGPFNIQFIAKNNEIKVIECNVRAARSFPFVSKVTNVDAIEMATRIMLELPVTPYPKLNMPRDYVGVKVPQFSFSRLAGADPILGVEMASTGEVACFGRDKYEAYLKGMLASGIKLPTKNVLLSIGSFSEKQELLPAVRTLHALGFTLYGSSGSADFYSEQGIPVIHLEALPEDDLPGADENNTKAAYSLLSHLTQGLSSLFISLPSKNKYRRPASFTSMGYRARRLAIDRSIPLITNVKNAKLFVEALARHRRNGSRFTISPVDFKTSHSTFSFPGLVNVQAFVPSIADSTSGARELAELTKASLAGGFTSVQLLPASAAGSAVADSQSLTVAEGKIAGSAHCDVSLSLAATAQNVEQVASLSERARSLFISFSALGSDVSKASAIAAHFANWPEEKPIVTDARGTDLASVLLLASLHNRSIHVTNVLTQDDVQLIALSKAKGLKVTCDVTVYALFFSAEMFPAATCLPSKADQTALWSHLADIDMFTVGTTPYLLATQLGHPSSAYAGISETLPLLLGAVSQGRLTLDHILDKLHNKPCEVFGITEQADSRVDVEVDRTVPFVRRDHWSPLEAQATTGGVHRVILRGRTVVIDEDVFSDGTLGSNVSSLAGAGKAAKSSSSAARRASFVDGLPGSDAPVGGSSALPPASSAMSPPSGALSKLRSPSLAAQDASSTVTPMAMNLRALPGPAEDASVPSLRSLIGHPTFARRHILSVKQFNRDDLHALFSVASELRLMVERDGALNVLKGRVLCTLFYEESTRTSASFEAAMLRCGGKVVPINTSRSSVQKGETLSDTIQTLGCYGDAIVMRHPAVGSAQEASRFSPVPIINGGDGIGEHPTQALLDVFTIREELGTVSGLTVTLLGDLKNGRTTHSLVRLLALYGCTINLVSPPGLEFPETLRSELVRRGAKFNVARHIEDVIGTTDVLYVTRIQSERFASVEEYNALKGSYVVNNALLKKAKPDCKVLHPLPRTDELAQEVDTDLNRAAYFRQMKFGLYVRMAALVMILATPKDLHN